MKKINLLLAGAAFAGLLQACSGSKSTSAADTSATTTDTLKATTVVKADSSAMVMLDTTFAGKAAVGGMAEVALGKMAAAKGADSKVKEFGNMMVMDHGKANAELMSIAKSKNITLPGGLDAEHQAKSDSLSTSFEVYCFSGMETTNITAPNTGKLIQKERLMAVPHTTLSMEAKLRQN